MCRSSCARHRQGMMRTWPSGKKLAVAGGIGSDVSRRVEKIRKVTQSFVFMELACIDRVVPG